MASSRALMAASDGNVSKSLFFFLATSKFICSVLRQHCFAFVIPEALVITMNHSVSDPCLLCFRRFLLESESWVLYQDRWERGLTLLEEKETPNHFTGKIIAVRLLCE